MLVVEHDEQTMRAADHLVDLGPGAGEHGGRIIAEGTAAQVETVKESLTGQFLAGTRTIAGAGEAAHARPATWRSAAPSSTTSSRSTSTSRWAC